MYTIYIFSFSFNHLCVINGALITIKSNEKERESKATNLTAFYNRVA